MAVLILGIIGGIFGILAGLFAVIFGAAFDNAGSEKSSIALQGWIALGASIIAIVAAVQAKQKAKRSGWLLVASGIIGLIAISFFYILPAILLVLAGSVALTSVKKNKPAKQKEPSV